MRFQVPQFVEVEDKIVGPLTLKQFIYIGGGVGMSIIAYLSLPPFFAILIILPVMAFAAALAFYRPNNRPFILLIESMFSYLIGSKLYIWKKEQKAIKAKPGQAKEPASDVFIPKLSGSKLKDMSWSIGLKKSDTDTVEADTPDNAPENIQFKKTAPES